MGPHIAASYLVQRAAFRVAEFFRHWYVDGTKAFLRRGANLSASIEDVIAVRVTLHHFFEPLFRDYTILGHILGPIFRAGRLAIGLFAYAVAFSVLFIAYLIWLALPVILIAYAITSAF